MKSIVPTVFFTATLLCASLLLHSQAVFPASDPRITVMGRSLEDASGEIEFDWPGVNISCGFTGSSCTLLMSDTKTNYYNVYLDDVPTRVISVTGDQEIILGKNLGPGPHSVRILKRTEGNQGKATFKGFKLDDGAELKKIVNTYDHKIEFIGNSITCGYGAEGKSKDEKFKAETENANKSFASITARAFNASCHLIAHSGQGLVRNYGDPELTSEYTMPDRYEQVFDSEKEAKWDFSKWIPDAVVINLGTNDFSTEPHPIETIFNRKYMHLIKFIREKYGEIPVFCVVGPMIDEPCYSYVKKMVEANRTHLNDQNCFFVGIPSYLMDEDRDLGSDYHPNYSGHIKMARHLVPVIASVTGWEYGEIE